MLEAEGGFNSEQPADIPWVVIVARYLELLRTSWPSIDSDIRASGSGLYAKNPDS